MENELIRWIKDHKIGLYSIVLYGTVEAVTLIQKTNGGFLISKIKQIQGRIFEKMQIEHGIHEFNGAQGRILFVLWENDDISISELAKRTGLARTTLTSMLDRLEKSGHVFRIHDTFNHRIIRIQLTETTRNLQKRYDEVSAKMSKVFYKGFSDQEIIGFEKNLVKILVNLTNEE